MGLNEQDIEEFYKLHGQLLLFVNERKKLIDNISSVEDLPKLGPEGIMKIRESLLKNPKLIISFVSENPNLLSKEELKIVEKWKDGIYADFFIVKFTKEYTIFYSSDSDKCYGVLNLISKFDEVLGSSYLPIMVKAWLIPFKDKIIYDGLIVPYRISFGGDFRNRLKGDYEQSIVEKGIMTSFELKPEKTERGEDKDKELLKFYLKSQSNRDRYYEEIDELKIKSPELEKIYYQEISKVNSRYIKEKINEKNISGWFAVLEDVIISSGKSKEELLENLNKMLRDEQLIESVHIFKTGEND